MTSDTIKQVHAREVLDSRGHPTVEVEVYCQGGAAGRAIVPSGASTGFHEACELRDGNPGRYAGKGVRTAVHHVLTVLGPAVAGMAASAQREIDRTLCDLDGFANKSRLGANAILGVSLACAHAAAAARNQPLWQYLAELTLLSPLGRGAGGEGAAPSHAAPRRQPTLPLPMVNLISGGKHAGQNLQFQDFLLLPIAARSFSEALHTAVHVYRALGAVLGEHGFEGVLVGDEGGFGPRLESNEQAIDMILKAFARAGLAPGRDAAIALDVASTHFYRQGRYEIHRAFSADDFAVLLESWTTRYPIQSIEDGMAEDDWAGWKKLTHKLGKRIQLIGDDLFVTNPERLKRGIAEGVANSILIKPNQIGTLTETLDVLALARAAGYRPIISARSGETEDATIADLAVATAAGQIKIGSVARSERLAKYNQLLRIEEQMGANSPFAQWQPVQ